MKTHTLVQGTAEWHAHRALHDNASDAPAMMGASRHKTRTQLLHERATGERPPVDGNMQWLFDQGHRTEKLALALAEDIVCEELCPVTGTNGTLSASFDGLPLDGRVAYEHKMLNKTLRAVMVPGCTGAALPAEYRIQMEQQCMVAEECERVLFMASAWEGNTLLEKRWCWYTPDLELRAQIAAGWAQFRADLATYRRPEIATEVTGQAPDQLPALRIELRGEVTASNLDAYRQHALKVFAGIKTDLQSDQDFADAEETVKWCEGVEKRLAAAKAAALEQTEPIDALFKVMDEISELARSKRLTLAKTVDTKKTTLRAGIVSKGASDLAAHVTALNRRIGRDFMPAVSADFAGAAKGKRTLDSVRAAVDTALAAAKISASETADRITNNLNAFAVDALGFELLFPDLGALSVKAAEDFAAITATRIAEHKEVEQKKQDAAAAAAAAVAAAKAAAEAQAPAPAPAEPASAAKPLHFPPGARSSGWASSRVIDDRHAPANPPSAAPATCSATQPNAYLELARHVASAFDGKFKSQPKPSVEWWARANELSAACLGNQQQRKEAA